MDTMKIEYVFDHDLWSADPHTGDENCPSTIPVVRLDAVDAILGEAVWAMQYVIAVQPEHQRAQAFLASPTVTDREKRQGGKKK